jgi:SPP1 family predicted phage head-tail adaptor
MPQPLAINPGTLRHLITIQSPNTTRDAAGQPIKTWNSLLTTRASIQSTVPATYKDSFANNALSSQASHIITIRWPGSAYDINPSMQVAFGSKTYLISAVDNVLERNRVLRIFAILIDGGSL